MPYQLSEFGELHAGGQLLWLSSHSDWATDGLRDLVEDLIRGCFLAKSSEHFGITIVTIIWNMCHDSYDNHDRHCNGINRHHPVTLNLKCL
jgi:hypothetical protein